ncbi:MAG: hypothetical protein WBB25_21170 [Sulfitobacter sp.]
MIRTLALVATLGATTLAGCTDSKSRILFDGQYFRAKISKVDKQRDVFVVTVKDPTKSIEGARLAAHHEATSYCVKNFGSSEINWVTDPLDETTQLRIADRQVSFQGRCPQAQRI